jgi:type I restriction enzyme S subunit
VSWPLVKIGDFCITGSGGTPSRSIAEYYQGDIPWIKSGDLRENIVTQATEFISTEAIKNCSAKMVAKGSILLAMYGATVGRMALLGIDAATNQAVCNITPDSDRAFTKYVYYALLSKVPEFLKNAVGGAQPNISQGIIRDTLIPLPPLEEQKRIAAILDKADAIRRKRQQAIKLADDFLRSVFLEMFGDPVTNPKGWEVRKIEEIAASDKYAIKAGPFGSALKKEDYVARGYKIYGQEQVIRDDLNYGDYFIDAEKYHSLISCAVSEGDMLISLVGSFGKIAVIPAKYQAGIINPRLMKVKFNSKYASPWFMKYLLTTKEMLRKIESMSHGGTMGLLNVGKVKELEVINPPIELQDRFLKIAESVNFIQVKFNTASAFPLFDVLSQKAFSGQL